MFDKLKQLFSYNSADSLKQAEDFAEDTQLDDSIVELLLAEIIDSHDFYEVKKLVKNKVLLICVLKSSCLTDEVLGNLDELVYDSRYRDEFDKSIFTFYDYVSSMYEGKSLTVTELLKNHRKNKKV